MRSIWTGAIKLSDLIQLPVKLGSATRNNYLGLKLVRKSDGSPVHQTRVAEVDGKEVNWNEVGKGYTTPDGALVILDKADFDKAYGPKNRVATVQMFTDATNVPPMAAKTAYWVQPDTGGEKIYALLAHSMQEAGKVAIVNFAMRDREAIAVLRPQDGYLSLEPLEWDTDMIKPDFRAPVMDSSHENQELAAQLVSSMTEKYDHTAQKDVSTERVHEIIRAKIETGQTRAPATRPDYSGAPRDLTATLQAAVQAQQGNNTTPLAPKRRAPRRRAA